jgi:hypothetical protein
MPIGSVRAILLGGGRGGLEVFDNFDRANGELIGSNTSDGRAQWQYVRGTSSQWDILSNRAHYAGADTDEPIAVVETRTSEIDVSLDVSSTGGDAIYFRVVDANNWIRIQNYGYRTSSTSCGSCQNYFWSVSGTSHQRDNCAGVGGGPNCKTYTNCGSSSGSCPNPSLGACCDSSGCYQNGGCGSYSCNCNTSYFANYRAELEKSVGGTVSTLQTWAGSYTSLRAVASLNTVRVYTGATDRGNFTINDHVSATRHGVGRATTEYYDGSAIDNFHAIPV